MGRTPVWYRFTTLLLAAASAGLVALAVINFQQRGIYQLPDDGVSWLDTSSGVQAWIVTPGGPGQRAGIREGDLLAAIDGTPIKRATEAERAVFRAGVWSQVPYELDRHGQPFATTVVIVPQRQSKPVGGYLELVGLLYVIIGAFVLVRRWGAPKSLHFYFFCVASFVLYTFHYTGKLNLFDSVVYWLNVVATVLTPALFLHFCLSFPEQPASKRKRSYALPLVYASGALVLALHLLAVTGTVTPLLAARWLVDRAEYLYLAGCFLLGAVILQRAYRGTRVPLLKQQLKWVTRGTILTIVPFAALYALPFSFGFVPRPWMDLSVFSLIFLPITFGYAIMHYRLMDVDIIFRRGIAYTLATATIAALYFLVVALSADLFRNHIGITSHVGWILAIVVTAVLFQPILNWIQTRLEKLFNRQRYDYRLTLLEFARELTSEVRVERLLEEVVGRLAETLSVDRLAVFLASESDGFYLAKSRGVTPGGKEDLSFLHPDRLEFKRGYLFYDSLRRPFGITPAAQTTLEQLDLHYYLPLKMKDRTLGYLGLGKTARGDLLSSEDADLLQTIAGYVSIALENAQLYGSLEQKALQYQALKDFNENIIESINAGVLACNLKREVEAWNSAMERLYELKRSEVIGKKLEQVFPAELMAELPRASDDQPGCSLYKFRMQNAVGRQLIVNVSVVPLVGRDSQVLGSLMTFNDLTERVNLEEQLVQAEKLSSIGLLAAGVAHEVNTPLAVIASQAQVLMKHPSDAEPQSHRPILEKITKAAFRASEIVNNLLKFSRVSGSERVDLDLNKLISETLSLLDPMLRASRISLNLQLTATLPSVYGNYGKLQQVLMNLLMNARDAMPRGGEITVATECEDSIVRVEISDNGVGIAPDHLSKIFDPFFTTKSASRGTGLGLAVTYGLIREHAGEIRVESALGQGSTFRLEFPTARKAVNVS
jgi:two-component system NtrC family sensor kinase